MDLETIILLNVYITIALLFFVNACASLVESKGLISLSVMVKRLGYLYTISRPILLLQQLDSMERYSNLWAIINFIFIGFCFVYEIFILVCICKEDLNNQYSEKSLKVDLLLCIFLGPLGVHKFYEGKIGIGILYLFTFGGFGIGGVIDLYQMLTGNACDKNGTAICRFNSREKILRAKAQTVA